MLWARKRQDKLYIFVSFDRIQLHTESSYDQQGETLTVKRFLTQRCQIELKFGARTSPVEAAFLQGNRSVFGYQAQLIDEHDDLCRWEHLRQSGQNGVEDGRRITEIGKRVNDHMHNLRTRQLFVRVLIKHKAQVVNVLN
ncbi:hypothetical protein KIN20_010422 [Parelaphostrongylus tenuis]|uniref:Uncharacterized protein n=1 Tax=Parelaphostrongylus tenuis TaxID=148309 RepID=A0AAD5QLF3_PARTN|nr:hypothetical protein KIN20_010422 [Parelaphostrongylus tenuis]